MTPHKNVGMFVNGRSTVRNLYELMNLYIFLLAFYRSQGNGEPLALLGGFAFVKLNKEVDYEENKNRKK